METLSSQSNQSTHACNSNKNTCFLEAHAMRFFLKSFSFISHIAFEELIF